MGANLCNIIQSHCLLLKLFSNWGFYSFLPYLLELFLTLFPYFWVLFVWFFVFQLFVFQLDEHWGSILVVSFFPFSFIFRKIISWEAYIIWGRLHKKFGNSGCLWNGREKVFIIYCCVLQGTFLALPHIN